AQDQRPVATGATLETPEDTPLDLVLAGEVATGAQAVYEVVDGPAHGLFKGTAPDLQYNPDADFAGEDFFTFRVGDGVRVSDLAVVRITVTPVNDAPVALAQDLTTTANRVIPLLLTGTDVEGDPLTFAIRARPAQGTLTGVPPLLSYRPEKNFVGEVAFSFTVSDGQLTSEPAIVRVTVSDNLRRELDGDGGWFGCSAAPGAGRGNGKMRRQVAAVHNGNGNGNGDGDGTRWWSLALLLIGLGLALAWGRRRAG
ncbi:cadherin-like domain-containing protein, partial [Myxococcota bacterium]|nr:cadherin-like domain-containing protein [Myxococcota bacterium]